MAEDSAATAIDVRANDTIGRDTGETLTVTAVTQGSAGGTVTFTATGVSYTPAANFIGADTFTYTISDGNGGTRHGATVTVTVTASTTTRSRTTTPRRWRKTARPRRSTCCANDTLGPDSGETLTVTAVTQGSAGGTVTFTATGVSYAPAANFTGADTFTYTIGDGNGGTRHAPRSPSP